VDKVKGKFVPILAQTPYNEDVWGSGGITPSILSLGTRWRRVFSIYVLNFCYCDVWFECWTTLADIFVVF
jgi:hypothetical protein